MTALRGDTHAATASYIESMLGELRSMSQEMDSRFLTYLIEMAMAEANQLSGTSGENVIAMPGTPTAVDLARKYMADDLD